MEYSRDGSPDIRMWEPFVWEYTSALSTMVLLPFLFWMFRQFPLKLTDIKRQVCVHIGGTIVFSLGHVVLMVLMREWIYAMHDGRYDFGPWLREMWYEYRKDAWGYFYFLFIYQMADFIYSRLKGEANLIDESDEPAATSTLTDHSTENAEEIESNVPKHFLVKKLDKEFLVKVSDIEWIESSGNYVNLHSKGRIYPLRSTLAQITQRLSTVGFSRIHRSHAINQSAIDHIQFQSSGDGEVELKSGKKLNISRRYKDALKQALS